MAKKKELAAKAQAENAEAAKAVEQPPRAEPLQVAAPPDPLPATLNPSVPKSDTLQAETSATDAKSAPHSGPTSPEVGQETHDVGFPQLNVPLQADLA